MKINDNQALLLAVATQHATRWQRLWNFLREKQTFGLQQLCLTKITLLTLHDASTNIYLAASLTVKRKRLLVQTCRQSHVSVCLSVCCAYCGKTADWIWMPFGVVSGVGR